MDFKRNPPTQPGQTLTLHNIFDQCRTFLSNIGVPHWNLEAARQDDYIHWIRALGETNESNTPEEIVQALQQPDVAYILNHLYTLVQHSNLTRLVPYANASIDLHIPHLRHTPQLLSDNRRLDNIPCPPAHKCTSFEQARSPPGHNKNIDVIDKDKRSQENSFWGRKCKYKRRVEEQQGNNSYCTQNWRYSHPKEKGWGRKERNRYRAEKWRENQNHQHEISTGDNLTTYCHPKQFHGKQRIEDGDKAKFRRRFLTAVGGEFANELSIDIPRSQTSRPAQLHESNGCSKLQPEKTNWGGSNISQGMTTLNSRLISALETNTNSVNRRNIAGEEFYSYGHSNSDYENHAEDNEFDYLLDSEDTREENDGPNINDGTNYGSAEEESMQNLDKEIEESAGGSIYGEQDSRSDNEYRTGENSEESKESYNDELAEYFE
ncbi:hypothetical protein K435DRAFT_867284 [Dendrothele bispora CBS 962.96]|uniref:Uncharacterized protein n=1 Tax=Dendrothele bispora (strain CBS 962.96) TaxID=1314807 RepID=A0A4S8LF25_DENBC|nr:hypothetical protein K435DRAFT_867284 [Dendrothele bispora CBS 962.96]